MKGKTLVLLGSILILIAMFTPAATLSAGIFSRGLSGYETDLMFSGVMGLILFLAALIKKEVPGKRFFPLMAIAAVIAMYFPISLFLKTAGLALSEDVSLSMGVALPLCGIGALLAFVGCLTKAPGAVQPEKPPEAPSGPPPAEPPASQ